MDQKRFYYSRSSVYGWCVYDREIQMPAYDACVWLLPPARQDEDGTVVDESPVLLESEYKAMRLCAKLNVAYKRNGYKF